MSLGNSPAPDRGHQGTPGPEIVAEVSVSTATAIVVSRDSPYKVLIANSGKHQFPVMPGGKVEVSDSSSDNGITGQSCVLREVFEETGTVLLTPRYIGRATDPNRDIRLVPASKLSSVVVTPRLPAGISPESTVKAHYGCPDYIFVGHVDERKLGSTTELSDLRFVDIRQIRPGDLSAGHDVIVLTYRKMLESGLTVLPDGALENFLLDRDALGAS